MIPLRLLTTPEQVVDRINEIFRHRPELQTQAASAKRPSLAERRAEPKLKVGWLAHRKLCLLMLEQKRAAAQAVGCELDGHGSLVGHRA